MEKNRASQPKNKKISMQLPKERIWELDAIRGLCILLMVMDHALFDMGFLFGPAWFPGWEGSGLLYALCRFANVVYWEHPLRIAVRVVVVACFIGLCGISCSFSRSNFKRGFKLLAVALAMTAVTAAMDAVMGVKNYYIIRCGVLHMLAVAILLYAGMQCAPRVVPLAVGVLLVGVSFLPPLAQPGLIPYVLGIGSGSYSADYFPLVPYVGYFLIGAVVGPLLYKNKCSKLPRVRVRGLLRPVCFTGRHALWFYLLHQPVVYGLLSLVDLFM